MTASHTARDKVISCLAKTVGQPEDAIDISKDLSAIGMDSLSLMRLKMVLEQSFETSLPDEFEYDVATGTDVLAYIERHMAATAS